MKLALEILPLSPARVGDFMGFFEGEAFSDNPKWASCYCQCFYEDHNQVDWPARTATQNRERACERIALTQMHGLLAYHQGQVVGWCNAAPRTLLHALDDEPVANAAETGTILCFLVAPRWRGQGVARALLAAACEHLRDLGMRRVEARPNPAATSTAQLHYGPLSLYLEAGFQLRHTEADGSVWVCKTL